MILITLFQGGAVADFGPRSVSYSGTYGIAFIPPRQVELMVRGLQVKFPENYITFPNRLVGSKVLLPTRLPGVKSIPHISLFHSTFESIPERVISDLLARIVKSQYTGVHIQMADFSIFQNRFVFWGVEKNKGLLESHHLAYSMLSRWVTHERSRAEVVVDGFTDVQKRNFLRYGNPLVGREWMPHIAVAYSQSVFVPDDILSMQHTISGNAPQIAFCKIGEFGTVQEIVRHAHFLVPKK